MRGLSLSYKESIDQVWQAAAVSGFFVVMRLNLILEEMIMEWNFLFFMNSVLLGVGLAMDAFSVSLANGMNEKNMKKSRMAYIAGVYAFFQFLMPMIGWICVHTIVQVFGQFQKFIPWIALILLLYIGGSMIKESVQSEEEKKEVKRLSFAVLMMQGIATSIDALAVGITFTFLNYPIVECMSIIGCTTFIISFIGVYIGKIFGSKYEHKAEIAGGIILIVIGLKILLEHLGIF